MMKRKTKKMLAILLVIAVIVLLSYPAFAIFYTLHHYEKTNPYIMTLEQVQTANADKSTVVSIPVDNQTKGLLVTNLVYFPNMNQLSFGVFYSPSEGYPSHKYQIAVLTKDGEEKPIMTAGGPTYLYQKLEKIFVNQVDIADVSKIVIRNR